ncbi:VWA domain-containing protein [Flagellimonas algicola]|uniref:VWA domain-containing protein n=1 Tax=Flagellimonas algicola TaxID=2583815 RepID=A0ABY2WN34_9FLAO|nr:VWA domain-containing protein [Allomuricauda algicola]TMU56401.1 VWA domain-containing protein [Allomuricauda algicola]
MEIRTVLLILLAAIVALTIVFYQYFHKNPRKGFQRIILASLRFLTLFCALLLLINPQFVKRDYFVEKSKLVLLVDESLSMDTRTDQAGIQEHLNVLAHNDAVQTRFEIHEYGFGNGVNPLDSVQFNQNNTDIYKALTDINEIFGNHPKSILLFTDGNQTLGRDYEYLDLNNNSTVHAVVIGDTTQYEDLSVRLINTNTYAFLKNKFPLEAQLEYRGNREVTKSVSVLMDGKTVHRENIQFSGSKRSQTLNTLIEAQSVGVKPLRVHVEPLQNERNSFNNMKETAIEIIDEKTKIGIVSDVLHPDIGALKKSIETNEQRTVVLLKPTDSAEKFNDVGLFILYQPTRRFKNVYERIDQIGANKFTIAGRKTDWLFLNQIQSSFFKERLNQTEEIIPALNNGFSLFGLGNFSVQGYPPLEGQLGDIEFKKESETLLFQRIRGVDLDAPLFSILTEGKQREAILFGENLWRWRAQNYRNNQNFEDFDALISKLMVYLSSNSGRNRLELDYDRVFDDASLAKVRASYYDESYTFDSAASLKISIQAKENDFSREAPLLLKGSYYETDLSDLQAGEYDFTVTEESENLKRSGSFKILDFNPEKQTYSSNFAKLQRLAQNNNGNAYLPDQMNELAEELSNSQQYTPIQKSTQNVVSLIDFKVLLGIMALTLALEWFIRKYKGLI